MKKMLMVVAMLAVGCTDESASRSALAAHGMSDVSFHGYAAFECSDSDTFATAFTATNAVGVRVRGVVCCGLLKSCTVRF